MINRYEETDVSDIWSETYKFETYLKVELAILEALEGTKIPAGTAKVIADKAVINPDRIGEIEAKVHHDIIAFCTSITENLTPDEGKFFHFGVTSSDIIDTSVALQLKASLKLQIEALEELQVELFKFCEAHKTTLAMGRSHGMYAEPLSFGQKFLSFYCEFKRRLSELKEFYQNEITGQFSGAVGNYTILNRELEKRALDKLGLAQEPLSTQVIPRDRIAKLVSLNGLLASAIERVAVEIRHLHRSEVAELAEGFAKGQKGSSTMPHKKNPISGENLTGMARVLRSHVLIALENIVLWHERDISHSSTERLYLPDHFGLMVYALRRLKKTISNLVVMPEQVEGRVTQHFVYLSSFYLHHLIEHTNEKREDLYEVVQGAAFDAKTSEEFHSNIVSRMKNKGYDIKDIPTPDEKGLRLIYLKEVDTLFREAQK